MAASSKPTAVHFTLAFFVTTTLILGIVCYLNGKELTKANNDAKVARDEAGRKQNDFTKLFDEVGSLSRMLGYQGDLGTPTDNPESLENSTVQKQLYVDLNKYGRDLVQPSPAAPKVSDTLLAMRTQLESRAAELASLQVEVRSLNDRLNAEKAAHLAQQQKLQESQADSEKQRQDKVISQNEILMAKDKEIEKLNSDYRQALVEKEQVRDELDRVRKVKDEEIGLLTDQLLFVRRKLNELENVSFEVPDGKVVRVISGTNGKVWIDRGKLDGLRSQTTFSVYTQKHDGVARGKEDVKAKIEITEVIDDHLSVARIITEDRSRPIQEGDPIYTPLWTSGQKEFFAFVGDIDINGNGKSDRELLWGIMDNVGAVRDLYIDDQGNRVPADGRLTANTKFLVVGKIPDPASVPGIDAERRAEIEKIQTEQKSLEEEALRRGIRVVRLDDFLTWIGISPQERLYLPGDDRPFTLKAGALSTTSREEIGSSRLSSGNVSEIFKKKPSGPQSPSNSSNYK